MCNMYFPIVLIVYFSVQLTLCSSQGSSNSDQLDDINLAIAEHVMNQANKPIWFGLENPVKPFIGRTSELSELKWGQSENKISIITGPRGIGKTELTKKYAQQVKHDNTSSILWLDASSHEALITSFKDLTVHVGNSLEEKGITTILRDAFEFFHNRKSLFILDHASSDNIIIRNLKNFLGNARKVNIILTSRDENWDDDYKIIKLKPFTKENSLEYFRIVLRKEINMHIVDSSAEKVSELLKHLPLAINRATQYIIHKNTMQMNGEYTMDDYVIDLLKYQVAVEPSTTPQPLTDKEIEESILEKIKDESLKIGNQLEKEVQFAWEMLTFGQSNKIGSKITNEVNKTGKQISNQTEKLGKKVIDLFSIG